MKTKSRMLTIHLFGEQQQFPHSAHVMERPRHILKYNSESVKLFKTGNILKF
jgi:hypothetical protein